MSALCEISLLMIIFGFIAIVVIIIGACLNNRVGRWIGNQLRKVMEKLDKIGNRILPKSLWVWLIYSALLMACGIAIFEWQNCS